MSIQRYDFDADYDVDSIEFETGDYVLFTDHAAAIAAKDAEIARLKAELAALLSVPDENRLRDAEELVQDVDDDAAEIAKLRKVVEAAKWYAHCRELAFSVQYMLYAEQDNTEMSYRFARASTVHWHLTAVARSALLAPLEQTGGNLNHKKGGL